MQRAFYALVGAYDMKYWAGITDNGWFEFLSQAGVDEVNILATERQSSFLGA